MTATVIGNLSVIAAVALTTLAQSSPVVTVSAGTVAGTVSSAGVETFDGIPYAQPPVGPLRLKPPRPFSGQFPGGAFNGSTTARACPQMSGTTSTAAQVFAIAADGTDEDCLTLKVQRPAGTSADAKLPVLFWIYGGGFEFGSTSMYDGSGFITHGTTGPASGHPFVFVAVNYRVGLFSFMAGKELQSDGSTNLGLRDQRLGLEWVADNIAAFGGDPEQVTLGGESAGAISVFDHFIINNGDNTYNGKPLFRAGILNSGSVIPSEPVDTGKAQDVYNKVVAASGCADTADTLSCLREAPLETLQAAQNSLPGIFSYRALDLAFLPRPDPKDSFFPVSPEIAGTKGLYAKVPFIIGDLEDEGTLFAGSQSNITNTDLLVEYLESYFSVNGADLMEQLVATYPDDPAAGSPFRTGDANDVYPQHKRLAAILGDVAFTLTRRALLAFVADELNAWSYLDSQGYGGGSLGAFHGSDFGAYFGGSCPTNVINTFRTAFISFAYYQDPNKIRDLGWPQWKSDNATGRQMLHIGIDNNTVIKDDFRTSSFDLLYNTQEKIRI